MCNCGCNQPEKIVIKVDGMTCGHCKSAVERAVKGLEGIQTATVDLEAKTLTVEAVPGRVTLDALREVIEEEGYTVI
ncbi:MAG TPA: cation transporter [Patescibacteria group bacterium]|nr:cation transporter [Patescibacteria group bacterium]